MDIKSKINSKKTRSNLKRDADGKIIPSPGRKKGVPNKITGEAKNMIALAFEGAGGLPALIKWAKKKPDIFYAQLYTKLIPMQVQGHIDATIENGDGQLLESQLVASLARAIEAARRSRDTGGVGEGRVVIIDNDATEEPVPQLVLSSKTGTKAA